MKFNIRNDSLIKTLCVSVPLWLAILTSTAYSAETLNIAAASNLTYVMPKIIEAFEAGNSSVKVRLSLASTGNLYAQIKNGAPFDLYLAADEKRPALLYQSGMTEGEPFVYAEGRLVLWSNKKLNLVEGLYVLSSPKIKRVALANPKHAPYGVAAREALVEAGLWSVLKDKFIYGENISQTAQFVQSGAAQAGFIAESLLHTPAMEGGSFYRIPEGSFEPILQRCVVLKRKGGNLAAARQFRDFLSSKVAREILIRYGYGVKR